MIVILFDIETDGLENATKIHVVSYTRILITAKDTKILSSKSITDYDEMRKLFTTETKFAGHYILHYDFPTLERILNIKINAEVTLDTFYISYGLYPDFDVHGLDMWGNRVGIKKVEIKDWKNLPLKEYIRRCQVDVNINLKMLNHFLYDIMMPLYRDIDLVFRAIAYYNYKGKALIQQEKVKINIDLRHVEKNLHELQFMLAEKKEVLSKAMPKNLGKIFKTRPKKMYNKDGQLSKIGQKWVTFLKNNNLPIETKIVREPPNPGSSPQLKAWLFTLGWIPDFYKPSTSKKNPKPIPQVSLPFGQGFTDSVKLLIRDNPQLEPLEDYYKIVHRIGLFKGFKETNVNGKIMCTAHGFTNTLRLKHSKPIANLPKPSKFYGKEVRGTLIAPKGYLLCGVDIASLEDSTKQHYIYFYDPEYVKEMRVPGFDPHLDIAKLAELITEDDEEFYKWAKTQPKDTVFTVEDQERLDKIGEERSTGKTINFSATYGAGGEKIANTLKKPLVFGYHIHKVYWTRNKAVKLVAKYAKVKRVGIRKYLYNPVSGLYYHLKAEKDRFSTLNQSTGVYVFDTFYREVQKRLLKLNNPITISFQYHDELFFAFPIVNEVKDKIMYEQILLDSIKTVNDLIQLNVPIGIDFAFGTNYAQIH